MATTIDTISSDPYHVPHVQPECDLAGCCYWFETIGLESARCANRNSMVCRKRLADVFTMNDPAPGGNS